MKILKLLVVLKPVYFIVTLTVVVTVIATVFNTSSMHVVGVY